MARQLIILTAVAVFYCNDVQAQRFFRGGLLQREFGTRGNDVRSAHAHAHAAQTPNRYRTPYPTSSHGISVGVGSYPYGNYPRPGQFDPYRFDQYVHDPYATGSFQAPDLLNDPYFRERHRYESRFPGRYRTPEVYTRAVRRHSHSMPVPSRHQVVPSQDLPPIERPLPERADTQAGRSAPDRLAHSLAGQKDGDVWLEFLMPDQVAAIIAEGNDERIRDLLGRYEGIQNSAELKGISEQDGFAATINLLRERLRVPKQSMSL